MFPITVSEIERRDAKGQFRLYKLCGRPPQYAPAPCKGGRPAALA